MVELLVVLALFPLVPIGGICCGIVVGVAILQLIEGIGGGE